MCVSSDTCPCRPAFLVQYLYMAVKLRTDPHSDVSTLRIQLVKQLHRLLVPGTESVEDTPHSTAETYIVNTIPPLRIKRPNLGTAPDQNVNNPSFLKILATQSKLFLYELRASIDCMRVLTVSIGMVVYTVMMPARPPSPNVLTAPSFSPGDAYDCASCLRDV
jgi:hypothetical protein